MPQTTYLPVWTAEYPILAKAQKPGGVTVLSVVGAGDVPNKPTYTAGTIQMVQVESTSEEEVKPQPLAQDQEKLTSDVE